MAEEVGKAKFILETDPTKFTRGLRTAESEAGRSVASIGKKFGKLGGVFKSAGMALTMGLTLPIVAMGGLAIKGALDFESSMNKIRFLTNATAEDMPAIEAAILDVANATGVLPTEAAGAFYFALSSGAKDAAQAQAVLTHTLMVANMGLGEAEVVTRAVLSVINAYEMAMDDAGRVTGWFLTMVAEGLAEPDELAQSLNRVLGVAKNLNIEVPQLLTGISTMTIMTGASGPRAISKITRALTTMLQVAASPNRTKMWEDAGGNMQELIDLVQTDFAGAMMLINDTFDNNAIKIKKFTGSQEAMDTVLAIGAKSGMAVYRAGMEKMGESYENLLKQEKAYRKTTEFRLKQLKSDLAVAMIELGRGLVPLMEPVLKILGKFIKGVAIVGKMFAKLPKPVRYAVVGILLFVAAIGPVLVIIGMLMGLVSALAPLLVLVGIGGGTAGTGLMATGAGALAAIAPLIVLVAVVAALALGAIWLMDNYEKVGEFFTELFSSIVEVTAKAWKAVHRAFVSSAKAILRTMANFAKAAIKILNPYNWVFGSSLVDMWGRIAKQSGVAYQDNLTEAWVSSSSIATEAAQNMVEGVGEELEGLIDVADEAGEDMGESMADSFNKALQGMRDQVMDLHDEVQRLAGLDTVESVAENLARATLELEALDLEGVAEVSVKAREAEIESINDKIDALRDEKSAMSDSISEMEAQGLLSEKDAKKLRARAKRRERAIKNEVKSLEKRRKEVKKQRTPEEKRLEKIELEIKQLDILSRRRDLEREIMELRGKAADATLATDKEILTAMREMIPTIESVTRAIDEQVADLWTRYIPAWEEAGGAGADAADAMADVPELFPKEIGDFDKWLDEQKEKLESWFKKNAGTLTAAGIGAIVGGVLGGILGGGNPLAIAAGAIIGAGLGAVVGRAFDKWGSEAWDKVKGFFKEFMPTSTSNAIATVVGGVLGGLLMGPLGIPVGAYLGSRFGIEAGKKALGWIGSAWEKVKGFLTSFLPKSTSSAIAAIAGGVIGGLILGPFGIPVGAALGSKFGTEVAGKVVEWVGKIWGALKESVSMGAGFLGSLVDIGVEIGKAIWEGIKSGLGNLGQWILDKIADMIPGKGLFGAAGGLFKKGFEALPGTQEGGPVRAGEPRLVGEGGTELFVPRRAGQVISNEDLVAVGRDGGRGPLASFEFNLTAVEDWDETKQKIMGFVEEKLDETAARTGMARRRFATLGTGAPRGR